MPCSNPVRKKKRLEAKHSHRANPVPRTKKPLSTVYRPRNHETPFFKIVRDHIDEFEKVYTERYQAKYGYWRPVIRKSIDKFLKCGDLKEGFARVRCQDCHEEFFVAFSCRQRSCCPSCDQKRALLLAHRLNNEVFAPVPHRQWVLTIPKRLRIFFRFDRSLLGKLCHVAWETILDLYALEVDGTCGTPAMIGAVQTFGDLINFHNHVHAVVCEGVFTESGHFVHITETWKHRAIEIWQDKVFELLLNEKKIDQETVACMRSWRHSGFSVDNSVRIEANDHAAMQRLVEYIARCPFSLARIISVTNDGKILYRASAPSCIPFPKTGDNELVAGNPRNFEIFEPLDFLAAVTQHLPDKGEHQIRYYGWYSNKNRGLRKKKSEAVTAPTPDIADQDWEKLKPQSAYTKKCRMTWAALIKAVYEVDPLKCPKCGGTMKIISFIERHQSDVIEKILRHCKLWKEEPPRPPPSEVVQKPDGTTLDYGLLSL
jgi:hypothetical protein